MQGDLEEAPGRLQGGNVLLAGSPQLRSSNYVASNEVIQDLTRRWARGPANLTHPDLPKSGVRN